MPWIAPIPERVILPPLQQPEEQLVAHDWGHFFRDVGGQLIQPWLPGGGGGGGFVDPIQRFADPGEVGPVERVITGGLGPEACEGMVWSGGTPPKGYKVVNFCGKGVLRKVRRRRRRRLLTASDKADISYIVATTGKGQLAASLIHRSAQ